MPRKRNARGSTVGGEATEPNPAVVALARQLEAALALIAELRAQLAAMEGERDTIREQRARMAEERDGLREQRVRMAEECDGLREQLSHTESERDELHKHLGDTATERDALRQQLGDTKVERDELREQLRDAESERGDLQEQIGCLHANSQKLRTEAQAARNLHEMAKRQLHDANIKHSQEIGILRRKQALSRLSQQGQAPVSKAETQPQQNKKRSPRASPVERKTGPSWRDVDRRLKDAEHKDAAWEEERPQRAAASAEREQALHQSIRQAQKEAAEGSERKRRDRQPANDRAPHQGFASEVGGAVLAGIAGRFGRAAGKRWEKKERTAKPEKLVAPKEPEQVEMRSEDAEEKVHRLDESPRRVLQAVSQKTGSFRPGEEVAPVERRSTTDGEKPPRRGRP